MHAMLPALFAGRSDPLASILAAYSASQALLFRDYRPARLTPSGLDRLYQASNGFAPATAPANDVGFLLSEAFGPARTVVLSNPFTADADGWTAGSSGCTAVWSAGTLVITASSSVSATVNTKCAWKAVTTVVGRLYRVSFRKVGASSNTPFFQIRTASDGGGSIIANSIGSGGNQMWAGYWVATGTTSYIHAICAQVNSATFTIDDVTVEEITGNYALQATAGSRGVLQIVSNRYVTRFDGAADNLLSSLAPAASMTMITAREWNAVSDKGLGASVGTNFFSLGTHSDGKLRAYIGSTAVDVTAATIVDVPGVAWLRGSGSDYYAGWKPFNGNPVETVTGSFSGSIPTTQGIALGAENDDGTAAGFHDGDAYADFAIQAALTNAEIAAVAGHFAIQ